MSRLLAIDTSGWWTGLALVERGGADRAARTVAEAGFDVDGSHAGPLLERIEWLMAEAGWERSRLDGYVACRGPGSFTGVRIGLGTVRGLAIAADRPCFGVGTLAAAAEALGPVEGPRVPLLAAGREEVYGAVYDAASTPPLERVEPWVGPIERALEGPLLEPSSVFFGSGVVGLEGAVGWEAAEGRIAAAPRGIASAAGRIVLARGFDADAGHEELTPLYVRPPDAIVGRRR